MPETTKTFSHVESKKGKVPCNKKPLAIVDLTPEEFTNEIQKGFDDLKAGRVVSTDDVTKRLSSIIYSLHDRV